MIKALVTGSKSFIGIHLVNRLKSRGWEVVEWGREEMQHRDGLDVPEHIDYIYNLAAAGSKKGEYTDTEMFFTNTFQVFDLLQETRDIPYKAFVQFSTSSCYGIKHRPMRDDDVLEPNFMYAATKAAADQLVRVEAVQNNKPAVIVRPFSVYGPGMQETKLIPTLFRKIKKGEELQLVSGNHDWIYIDDFLDALDVVIENVGHLTGRPVNIGTGLQTDNFEVAKMVSELVDRDVVGATTSTVNHSHYRVDSLVWRANINTLKSLGWEPKVDLREGLRRML